MKLKLSVYMRNSLNFLPIMTQSQSASAPPLAPLVATLYPLEYTKKLYIHGIKGGHGFIQ